MKRMSSIGATLTVVAVAIVALGASIVGAQQPTQRPPFSPPPSGRSTPCAATSAT